MNTHRTYLLGATNYRTKIDVLRDVFATPGTHVLKDVSTELDRLQAEARDVIAIHGRDASVARLSPLVLRIEVRA